MSQCPNCKAEINFDDYPDHWTDGATTFSFECNCGAEFEVVVDWSPSFYVRKDFHMLARAERVP